MKTYWSDIQIETAGKLTGARSADICVVGAGIAGMSTAYMLVKAGFSVIVLEAREVAGGETARSTAHLSSALDDGFRHLENMYGTEDARIAVQSHCRAIEKIEHIIRTENIDCGFKWLDGYLFNPVDDGVDLEAEMRAARRLGLNVTPVTSLPFAAPTGLGLKFADQAVFHPVKYIQGLARVIGAENIHTQSRVVKCDKGDIFTLHTGSGSVTAKSVVMATHTPFIDDAVAAKNIACRSYVACFRMPKGNLPEALYWDTMDPYHHCRVCPFSETEDLLMAGGEDHRTGCGGGDDDFDKRFLDLENWARKHVPNLGAVEYRWSGQVMEPVDSLAFIGRPQAKRYPGLYIVTGGSGHGLTHGMIAGMLITDMVRGQGNPWQRLYNPDRRLHKTYKEFLQHNLNYAEGLAQHFWPACGTTSDIKNGEGAIVQDGLGKKAVYRDEHGKCHVFSAACPHMKGLLSWNNFEKSWDCRCHGSRFTALGDILNGPADKPMQECSDDQS